MESLNLQGWLPISIWQDGPEWRVDWCWFGQQRLDQPFFRDSVDDALSLPFNQAFRRQTSLAALSQWQAESAGVAPSAFVYHASRCGLTLISQMLAQLDSHVVVSEPPALDILLRADLPRETRLAAIRGLLSAYGQVRSGQERALVIKLEAWNIRERQWLRECFPEVPWLYLYREPLEIAVSHMRQGGMQMIPGMLGSAWLDGDQGRSGREDEIARRLGLMLAAGLEHCRAEGNLLVNYSELPGAMGEHLAGFFGLDHESAQLALRAAGLHAKQPSKAFVPDSQHKRDEASAVLRERVEFWTRQSYEALEALRLGAR
ncbi:sulfotransferase family protein [Pseudomonas huaxiensis]|uniref:sulfotransferase family protein n=1 Tax=Pseudomonas huaxiensis TaxID=2213017 RepID=UPI000DA6A788|nr:sulfotransferase family protein [Pseudomonas huaxiensis]